MNETDVQDFWQHHPCGEAQVGGLARFRSDYETFFREYDQYRYDREGHILACLDNVDFEGKRTLEIGLGQGADSEQIIRRGAKWSGVDLTAESINRVGIRLELKGLPFEDLVQGSVLELPFEDNSFDLVFRHGVLHHVPDIQRAQKEIRRVLKPGGVLIAMLYAKYFLELFALYIDSQTAWADSGLRST
jgi:ubiquinone/menaquinone biosynthesis C-methylase UbiE